MDLLVEVYFVSAWGISCWRGIFQSISFPFSLATSFIIELLSFITQYVIKVKLLSKG